MLVSSCRLRQCFNSRTPGGVRRNAFTTFSSRSKFQFTHPGRGATPPKRTLIPPAEVSIHAPREGCDGVLLFLRATLRFQFTHPGRGATLSNCEGDTRRAVSIHAPREGCDYKHCLHSTYVQRFNSRTPGGVRHKMGRSPTLKYSFQFTHPGRGATYRICFSVYHPHVSIHAPREGCDSSFRSMSRFANVFQFTHPGRGATTSRRSPYRPSLGFNSRTPGGVRQIDKEGRVLQYKVSIHAPREGCDE